jgi:hypothetical protein
MKVTRNQLPPPPPEYRVTLDLSQEEADLLRTALAYFQTTAYSGPSTIEKEQPSRRSLDRKIVDPIYRKLLEVTVFKTPEEFE